MSTNFGNDQSDCRLRDSGLTMAPEEFFALPENPRPLLGAFPLPGCIHEGEQYFSRGDGLREDWRASTRAALEAFVAVKGDE